MAQQQSAANAGGSTDRLQLREAVTIFGALRHFDLIDPSLIVRWAARVWGESDVLNGMSSLVELDEARTYDVDSELAVLAQQIGLAPMTHELAGRVVAGYVASKLSSGRISPFGAARELWQLSSSPGVEPHLRVFAHLTTEWEDRPAAREALENAIRSEAQHLEEDAPPHTPLGACVLPELDAGRPDQDPGYSWRGWAPPMRFPRNASST